jgi:hypothetical protein
MRCLRRSALAAGAATAYLFFLKSVLLRAERARGLQAARQQVLLTGSMRIIAPLACSIGACSKAATAPMTELLSTARRSIGDVAVVRRTQSGYL